MSTNFGWGKGIHAYDCIVKGAHMACNKCRTLPFTFKVNPVCLVSVAAITGGFIRHCNRCAYGLTAARRAGPSMQTLGPLLQYTGCMKQRYTSYRGYFTLLYLTDAALLQLCKSIAVHGSLISLQRLTIA